MEDAETRKCPNCQYIMSPTAKFCPSCGRQVRFDENSENISGSNGQETTMAGNGADVIEEKSAVISLKDVDKELKNPFLLSKDNVRNKILNPELKPLPPKKKFLFREWKVKNEDIQKVNDELSCDEVTIEGIPVTAKEKTLEEPYNEDAGFREEENSVEVMRNSSQEQEHDLEGLETDDVSSVKLAKEISIDEIAIEAEEPLDNYQGTFDGLKAEIDDNDEQDVQSEQDGIFFENAIGDTAAIGTEFLRELRTVSEAMTITESKADEVQEEFLPAETNGNNDELNVDKKSNQCAEVIETEAGAEEIEGAWDMGDEAIGVQWIPHRNEQLENEGLVVPITDETVEESKNEQIDSLENPEIEMMENGSQDFIEVEGKSIELVSEEGMDLNDLKSLLDLGLNENNSEAEKEKTEVAEESTPIIETSSVIPQSVEDELPNLFRESSSKASALSDESDEVGLSPVILRESEPFEEETLPDKEEPVIDDASLKKTEEQISEVQETVETEYTERLLDHIEESESEEVRIVDSDELESDFQKEEKPIEIDSAASNIFPESSEESANHEQSEENAQMPNDLFEIIQNNIEDQVEATMEETVAQEKTIQPNRIITSPVSRGFGRREQEEAKKVSKMNLPFNKRRR